MGLDSQLPPLPPLVTEDYQWQQSPTDPSVWRRCAIGTENVVGLQPSNKSGEYDLFLSCTVQFHNNGLTVTGLEQAIQNTCLRIRSQHPEVAQTVSWDEAGSTWIQAHVINDQAQLDAWARSIVIVETSNRSAADICNAIEEQRQLSSPADAKSVTLYVTAPVESRDSVLTDTTIQFLFHVNHLYFDGMSIRRFAGDLFHTLGTQILAGSGDENAALKSGPEHLSPPVLEVLGQRQEISGSSFETHRAKYMGSTMQGMNNWGLSPRRTERGRPRHILHTFSAEESSNMIRNVKTSLGVDFTITHLAQAAVFLALLETNPPGPDVPDSQVYLCLSPVDGRRFLEKDYARGSKFYYPVCTSNAPIIFEDLKSYDIGNADAESLVDCLSRACRVAKDSFSSWINQPCHLPATLSMSNFIAHMIAENMIPKTTGLTAPLFASDGVNEKWIPAEVFDVDNQQKVLSVKTVHLLLNQYMPFLSIRLDSWRGCSRLSIDYNDGAYSREDAETFLQKVTSMMLKFSV